MTGYAGESPEAAPEADLSKIMWYVAIFLFAVISIYGLSRVFSMFA